MSYLHTGEKIFFQSSKINRVMSDSLKSTDNVLYTRNVFNTSAHAKVVPN